MNVKAKGNTGVRQIWHVDPLGACAHRMHPSSWQLRQSEPSAGKEHHPSSCLLRRLSTLRPDTSRPSRVARAAIVAHTKREQCYLVKRNKNHIQNTPSQSISQSPNHAHDISLMHVFRYNAHARWICRSGSRRLTGGIFLCSCTVGRRTLIYHFR